MQLSTLQTHNQRFTISAFDHRSSLADKMGLNLNTSEGISQFIELKRAFMEVFSPLSSGVLTDPIYGKHTVESRDEHAGLLMSLEESGYEGGKGVVPPMLENWGVAGIKGYRASAKLLLYYNPHEPNAAAKRALTKSLYQETRQQEIPFLFEPVLYPLEGQSDFKESWTSLQQQTVEEFDEICDVLKIEFPGLHSESEQEKHHACQMINQYASKPWIILSQGMEFVEFKQALGISLNNGGAGFAVGRAVWQEIEQWSLDKTGSWPESMKQIRNFLDTTATVRLQSLIELVVR